MSLPDLKRKIENREACLAVIGLGYVGLPVACAFAEAGFNVLGIELRAERVAKLNRGESPIDGQEPGLEELLMTTVAGGKFRATTSYEKLKQTDVVLIAVETPVDVHNIPQYRALKASLQSLSYVMKPGTLVVIESTIAPGTMKETVLPLLEKGSSLKVNQGFYLGNCPERVMPGRLLQNLRQVSRVVGGMTPETTDVIISLYRCVVQADLDPADCVTAELVKTAENAYRDVQIAFANEVALICEAAGGDVWKVRELVNKSPGRQMLLPGAGVGGHCIPKDPWLLAYGAEDKGVPLRLIPAARAVNDSMPQHVVNLIAHALGSMGKGIEGSRILVMGYAYLENSDDTRNSPSEVVVKRLQEMGAEVAIHDPNVSGYKKDLMSLAKGCHAVVLMVRHKEYSDLDLRELKNALDTPLLVDCRRLYTEDLAHEAGLSYFCLGMGNTGS